jgi:hypothetical protein
VSTIRTRAVTFTAATAIGFVDTGHCVASPAGGMGTHFVHPGRLGGGIDAAEPEILLYEAVAQGRSRLVGVEYLGDRASRAVSRSPAGAGP